MQVVERCTERYVKQKPQNEKQAQLAEMRVMKTKKKTERKISENRWQRNAYAGINLLTNNMWKIVDDVCLWTLKCLTARNVSDYQWDSIRNVIVRLSHRFTHFCSNSAIRVFVRYNWMIYDVFIVFAFRFNLSLSCFSSRMRWQNFEMMQILIYYCCACDFSCIMNGLIHNAISMRLKRFWIVYTPRFWHLNEVNSQACFRLTHKVVRLVMISVEL